MTILNKRRLLRALSMQRREALESNKPELEKYTDDLIGQVVRGKYDMRWTDYVIPSLFLIFTGMMLALIFLGVILEA